MNIMGIHVLSSQYPEKSREASVRSADYTSLYYMHFLITILF